MSDSQGAFGSSGGGAFGQNPQQPQQPQANPMFGNLGGASNTSVGGNSGFGEPLHLFLLRGLNCFKGAFGGASNGTQNSAANPMFGAAKPTGFGAFGGGGGSTFGGGGTFGSTNTASGSGTTTGLFGQPAATNTTSAFGGGGLFGKPATTPFSSTQGRCIAFTVPICQLKMRS